MRRSRESGRELTLCRRTCAQVRQLNLKKREAEEAEEAEKEAERQRRRQEAAAKQGTAEEEEEEVEAAAPMAASAASQESSAPPTEEVEVGGFKFSALLDKAKGDEPRAAEEGGSFNLTAMLEKAADDLENSTAPPPTAFKPLLDRMGDESEQLQLSAAQIEIAKDRAFGLRSFYVQSTEQATTYLPTYLPTHPPTYLPTTHLLTFSSSFYWSRPRLAPSSEAACARTPLWSTRGCSPPRRRCPS